jgi:hypothetical protein
VKVGYTYQDEMCNIFFLYFTKNGTGVTGLCTGSVNSSLEARMPDSASVRPPFKFFGNWTYTLNEEPVVRQKINGMGIHIILFFDLFLIFYLILIKKRNQGP